MQKQVDHHESERVSMERALNKLDDMVSEAMTIEMGPGAPERLAADLEVAAAAKQALEILRVVQVKTCLQNNVVCLRWRRISPPYSLFSYIKGHLQISPGCHGLCGMQANEASNILPHRREA